MKKLVLASALSAALIAGPAAAQSYVGLGAGQARTDSNQTSYKVYGGFQFNPTWGLEAGYNDLGRYRSADISNWTLAGTGTLPLGANFSLLGKLGAAWNRPKFSGASNQTSPMAGVGLGYDFTPNIGARLEYEYFGKLSNASNVSNSNGSNLGLSLKYKF